MVCVWTVKDEPIGSPSYFQSNINTSAACKDGFCDANVSRSFVLHMASFVVRKSICKLSHKYNKFNFVNDSKHFFCFHTANKIKANPADIYLLKVNNRNSRTRCEVQANFSSGWY